MTEENQCKIYTWKMQSIPDGSVELMQKSGRLSTGVNSTYLGIQLPVATFAFPLKQPARRFRTYDELIVQSSFLVPTLVPSRIGALGHSGRWLAASFSGALP